MALKINCNKVFHGKEVVYTDAYLRVDSFEGDKNGIHFDAAVYTDSSKTDKIEQLPKHYSPVDIDKPILGQCYEYLKSREEYAEAEDC